MEAMRHQQQSSTRRDGLRGQVVIIFALASVVLVGMLALAVDVGMLLTERRQVQSAADAGALAAANASLANLSPVGAGQAYGSMNADVPIGNVQVNQPPTQGRFAGDSAYIEVIVTKQVERYFLGAVYQGPWEVQASAVAVVEAVTIDAALLALNRESGGIQLNYDGGFTEIQVVGGSAISNYNIVAQGNATLVAEGNVNASQGISHIPGNTITGQAGTNSSAPPVDDPLSEILQSPNLPAAPGNPVPSVNPASQACYDRPTWYVPGNAYVYEATAGTFPANNSSCIHIFGTVGGTFNFPNDHYRFGNNSGIYLEGYPHVSMVGGIYNYTGPSGGIHIKNAQNFVMQGGQYSFLNGAKLEISGNSPNNTLGGTFYFGGGGGIKAAGSYNITLNAGTYIFDGGAGIAMSGPPRLHLNAGVYEFWFLDGAGLSFTGGSTITADPGAYVRMYFYGTSSKHAEFTYDGNTEMTIPSGEYYFDNASMLNTGSGRVRGDNVFFYFRNDGRMAALADGSFAFNAPSAMIYPGYVPGVVIYSERGNTAPFIWTGKTGGPSSGIIYIPSAPVYFGRSSKGMVFTGQFIADSFYTKGDTSITLTYYQYIETDTPVAYLVD